MTFVLCGILLLSTYACREGHWHLPIETTTQRNWFWNIFIFFLSSIELFMLELCHFLLVQICCISRWCLLHCSPFSCIRCITGSCPYVHVICQWFLPQALLSIRFTISCFCLSYVIHLAVTVLHPQKVTGISAYCTAELFHSPVGNNLLTTAFLCHLPTSPISCGGWCQWLCSLVSVVFCLHCTRFFYSTPWPSLSPTGLSLLWSDGWQRTAFSFRSEKGVNTR